MLNKVKCRKAARKFTLMLSLFIFACSMQSLAQDTTKAKKENFNWQKNYMDEVGIPADIQLKIETIKKEAEVKVKELRKDKTMEEESRKEKIKEIQKKKGEDIMALLTKEQKQKVKEIRERLKKQNGEN